MYLHANHSWEKENKSKKLSAFWMLYCTSVLDYERTVTVEKLKKTKTKHPSLFSSNSPDTHAVFMSIIRELLISLT